MIERLTDAFSPSNLNKDYLVHRFHLTSVLQHLRAKVLSNGGLRSDLCQFCIFF